MGSPPKSGKNSRPRAYIQPKQAEAFPSNSANSANHPSHGRRIRHATFDDGPPPRATRTPLPLGRSAQVAIPSKGQSTRQRNPASTAHDPIYPEPEQVGWALALEKQQCSCRHLCQHSQRAGNANGGDHSLSPACLNVNKSRGSGWPASFSSAANHMAGSCASHTARSIRRGAALSALAALSLPTAAMISLGVVNLLMPGSYGAEKATSSALFACGARKARVMWWHHRRAP